MTLEDIAIVLIISIIFIIFIILSLWIIFTDKKTNLLLEKNKKSYHNGIFDLNTNYFEMKGKYLFLNYKRINIYEFINLIISKNKLDIKNFIEKIRKNPQIFQKKKFIILLFGKTKNRKIILNFYYFNQKANKISFIILDYDLVPKHKQQQKIRIAKKADFNRIYNKIIARNKKKSGMIFCYSVYLKNFYNSHDFKNNKMIENNLFKIVNKIRIFFRINVIYDENFKIFHFFKHKREIILNNFFYYLLYFIIYSSFKNNDLLNNIIFKIFVSHSNSKNINIKKINSLQLENTLKINNKFEKFSSGEESTKLIFKEKKAFIKNKYSSGVFFYLFSPVWNVNTNSCIGYIANLNIEYNNIETPAFKNLLFPIKEAFNSKFSKIVNDFKKTNFGNKKIFWIVNFRFFCEYRKEIILFLKRNKNFLPLFSDYSFFNFEYLYSEINTLQKENIFFGFHDFKINNNKINYSNLWKFSTLKYIFLSKINEKAFFGELSLKNNLERLKYHCDNFKIKLITDVGTNKNFVINLFLMKFIYFFGLFFEKPRKYIENKTNNLECTNIKNTFNKYNIY